MSIPFEGRYAADPEPAPRVVGEQPLPEMPPEPANNEYREPLNEARQYGVEARNEKRLTRAVRRQVAEEIAVHAELLVAGMVNPHKPYNEGFAHACRNLAAAAREIGAKETT